MATLTGSFPTDAKQVAAALEQTGWVCLEDAVSAEWLSRAQSHVLGLLDQHGRKFFSIVRPADQTNSIAGEIAHHPMMQDLLRGITEIACPDGVVDWEPVYNMLRVVSGPHGEKGSCQFHYDASVVTALVPIFMPDPESGQSGELIVFPNHRGYRSLVMNLLEKMVVQSPIYRWMTMRKLARDGDRYRRILKPGSIYLFFGYRTYHGNLPCHSNALRATMLLHYGNPHGKRFVLKALRDLRGAIEKRRLARPPAVPVH